MSAAPDKLPEFFGKLVKICGQEYATIPADKVGKVAETYELGRAALQAGLTLDNIAEAGEKIQKLSEALTVASDDNIALLNANAKLITLWRAIDEWTADRVPRDRGDAELMKAIWDYTGDRTEPCAECDGNCDEPCAPVTAKQAKRSLDDFIAAAALKAGNQ